MRRLCARTALFVCLIRLGVGTPIYAQSVDVTLQVRAHQSGKAGIQPGASEGIVIWLTPIGAATEPPRPMHYRLVQKDKQFSPHLLVVPTGSSVDFPNLDPFFHNVFSLFNGKRFDLGLYESGSTRAVRFDHDGVSYIFCNIHPEMSAVVISLSTPYFAMSPPDGALTLHSVPPGAYELHVWAEGSNARDLNGLTRRVVVSAPQTSLGTVDVAIDARLHPHKNKFGEDYQAPNDSLY